MSSRAARDNTPYRDGERINDSTLLEVKNLNVFFRRGHTETHVIRDLSFSVNSNESVGIVGESGSGKTVTALSILGLLPKNIARVEGQIVFGGLDLLSLTETQLRSIRGSKITMVFQEPMSALDPLFKVGDQIAVVPRIHKGLGRSEARKQALNMLRAVGIADPMRRMNDYPHQLSGGMQQRIMIAMALVGEPQLIIADEPTTALDVTIQAQILSLLKELQSTHNSAILLISHDMGIVSEACERLLTMYAGEIIEEGQVDHILEQPLHPYTSGLLQAIPRGTTRQDPLYAMPGRIPSFDNLPEGCHFGSRCPYAKGECSNPQVLLSTQEERRVRCWRHNALDLTGAIE